MGNEFGLMSGGEHPTFVAAREEGVVLSPGTVLAGRFEIIETVGAGGMGVVYKVRDLTMGGRIKALKVMLPSLLQSGKAQQRFIHEAEIAQSLAHPNIVNTFDMGTQGNLRFITMEFLEGRSLAQELAARGTLPLDKVVQIALQALDALAYAHKTTVHRDIKPQNIFLCKDGSVKLLDFGLARVMGSERFTQSGAVVGTVGYMAPEQMQGREVTAQTDLYSLGVVLYECLTGKLPVGVTRLPSKLVPGLPTWADQMVMGMMYAEPEKRPPDAAKYRRAIKNAMRQPTGSPKESARPAGDAIRQWMTGHPRVMIGAVAALVVCLLSFAWLDQSKGKRTESKPTSVAQQTTTEPVSKPTPAATPAVPQLAQSTPGKIKPPEAVKEQQFAGIDFVWIEPGTFLMGNSENGQDRGPEEGPQHEVTIAKGFWLGKYEVTQAQWEPIMGSSPSYFKGDGNLPVENVTWNDCQEFIQKLNDKGEGQFRLPTEAEWEYACRAGSTTQYCFGDSDSQLDDYAWCDPNSGSKTHPVGEKKPNAWGLYDMHGNVYEWCRDWWHNDYTGAPADGSAWEQPAGPYRVLRGGMWISKPWGCQSAHRYYSPDYQSNLTAFGFRLARTQLSDPISEAAPTSAPESSATTPTAYMLGKIKPDKPLPEQQFAGIDFVWIEPGKFLMGSPDSVSSETSFERPQHEVTIANGFWMGKYEVTQAQWQRVMDDNPSYFKGAGNLPVENVSWLDCQEFINRLNEKGEATFRLPTEAEWEYACRAGTSTRYCFGDRDAQFGDYAWLYSNLDRKSHPVGQKKPNMWGLYDMHGNVSEWCQDCWHADYTEAPADGTASEQPPCPTRVVRGGSCQDLPSNCRSANRLHGIPAEYYVTIGFRLLRTP